MTGIATTCRNNPPTGRQGCSAPYSGRQCHCVAPAAWSTHPDGLCHETFGTPGVCDRHTATKVGHVDPRTVERLHQDDRGVWHGPPPATDAFTMVRNSASGGGGW